MCARGPLVPPVRPGEEEEGLMLFEDGSSVAEIDRRAREQTTVEPNAWAEPVGFVSAAESKEAALEERRRVRAGTEGRARNRLLR